LNSHKVKWHRSRISQKYAETHRYNNNSCNYRSGTEEKTETQKKTDSRHTRLGKINTAAEWARNGQQWRWEDWSIRVTGASSKDVEHDMTW